MNIVHIFFIPIRPAITFGAAANRILSTFSNEKELNAAREKRRENHFVSNVLNAIEMGRHVNKPFWIVGCEKLSTNEFS